MSKSRSRNQKRLRAVVAAAVTTSTYLVIDAGGKRHSLSPLRWAQYHASHAIEPVQPGSPVARVRPGYTVRRDSEGGAVVVAIPHAEPVVRLRSNFWSVFWRSYIYSPVGGRMSLAVMLRAIAEDHQQASVVIERRLGVAA